MRNLNRRHLRQQFAIVFLPYPFFSKFPILFKMNIDRCCREKKRLDWSSEKTFTGQDAGAFSSLIGGTIGGYFIGQLPARNKQKKTLEYFQKTWTKPKTILEFKILSKFSKFGKNSLLELLCQIKTIVRKNGFDQSIAFFL